jgi:hypothetical protein
MVHEEMEDSGRFESHRWWWSVWMNVIKREGKVVNNKQCVCSEREIN